MTRGVFYDGSKFVDRRGSVVEEEEVSEVEEEVSMEEEVCEVEEEWPSLTGSGSKGSE